MPVIHPVEIARMVAAELPRTRQWRIANVPLDYDFSRAQSDLEYLDQPAFEGYPIVGRWEPLYIFGEERYAEGGGAISVLCVSAVSGAVVGLDIEREGESLFFL